MENGKPWYASMTIWGAFGTVGASLGTAYYSYTTGNIPVAIASLGTAFTGLQSIVGRLNAKQPIGKPAAAAPK